jgi:methanogenic corrinoid protein MtbC1
LEAAKQTIRAVRSGPRGDAVKIIVGGLAFADTQELPEELGADGYAANPFAAVTAGRKLVGLT